MRAGYQEIENVLVVVNPESTRASLVKSEVLDRLDASEWAGRYTLFETQDPKNGANNAERIGQLLVQNQVIFVPAGDGTFGEVMAGADLIDDKVLESILFSPLPYGSGNDASRAFHGRVSSIDPLDVLDFGEKRSEDLISITLNGQKETAILYVGYGWTGEGSEAIGEQKNRQRKKGKSSLMCKAFDAMSLVERAAKLNFKPSFKFSEGDEEEKEAAEILIANTEYLAGGVVKVERSLPGKLVCIEYSPDEFLSGVLNTFANRFSGGAKGNHIVSRTITIEPNTVMMKDGESKRLKERTEATIGVKPSRVNIIVLPKNYGLWLP